MTYSIKIKIEDGFVTEAEHSGEAPDGIFEITGSDDGNRIHLAVHQHDAEGRIVTSAEHILDRAEKALHQAEADVEAAQEAGAAAGLEVAGSVAVGESVTVTGD